MSEPMPLAHFLAHATEVHGFDFSGVGYPQPLDVEFHRHMHTVRQDELDHTHDDLTVDWGLRP